jgi:hypothetical protein
LRAAKATLVRLPNAVHFATLTEMKDGVDGATSIHPDLSQMGRHADAESAARALLATLPQAGETVFLLAYAIHQHGRLEEAIPQYELALR